MLESDLSQLFFPTIGTLLPLFPLLTSEKHDNKQVINIKQIIIFVFNWVVCTAAY